MSSWVFCPSVTFTSRFYGRLFQNLWLSYSRSILTTLSVLVDVYSNISTISPCLAVRVLKFSLLTCKSTNLLSMWCSDWIIVWLDLHLTLDLSCMTSSLWKFPMPFMRCRLLVPQKKVLSFFVTGTVTCYFEKCCIDYISSFLKISMQQLIHL